MAARRKLRQTETMAVGFGVGSVLFALGAVLAIADAPTLLANVTYAIGAVFFTCAAAVQWRQASDPRPKPAWKDFNWLSSVIQFVGTLCFNVMTLRAVLLTLQPDRLQYQDVWTPDVLGSALFFISSWIAWHPAVRARRHELSHGRSRLICQANMFGSVFFAVSAWGAMLLPSGTLASGYWDSMGTLLGAIGFLVGAIALYPRKSERATVPEAA